MVNCIKSFQRFKANDIIGLVEASPAKLSTIPKIMGTQASRRIWGHAPQEIL